MEKGLTSYVLNYLLSTCFDSKADMARQLDMSKRALQRVMNEPQLSKGGSVALVKALCYEKAKVQLEQLRATKTAREAQADAIGAFMFEVQELDVLTEFDEKLWLAVIDKVTVHANGRMSFRFRSGTEIDA